MEEQIHKSVCPLDCPDACALRITIRDGRMVHLAGAVEHPITQGFACVKMAKYPQRQEHPQRLHVPQKRIGAKGAGQFVAISWEEALETIAARLRENIARYGEQSVLPYCYAGTMGLIERDHPLAFFRALGASELDWTICSATGSAGWEANYGPDKLSVAPEDVAHAQLIILWGINVLRSNSHLAPWLKAARRQGAHILHIDPYHNETSRFADEHWPVVVGSDTALALALGGEILRLGGEDRVYLEQHANSLDDYRRACQAWPLERAAEFCGIEADKIGALAAKIAAHPATFIKVGYGLTRNESGGNAVRAITLLSALTGAWQHRGGGAALSTSGAFGLNTRRYSGLHLLKPDRRHVNHNQLGWALEGADPPISSLIVFNSNPAAVAPDSQSVLRGLQRQDLFTVVLDHFQTDTADYADILLPATTFLEHADLYSAYGHYYLQWAEPILPPRGECRPNSWVFQQLAKRLGLEDPILAMSSEQLAAELLDSQHPHLAGIRFEQLKEERSLRISLPSEFRPYARGSHFPDGKIRFSPAPQQLEFQEKSDAEFPLRLISPPGAFFVNTSMGNIESLLQAAGGEPTILVHPDDAQRCDVADGQQVTITSRHGTIRRKAIVTADVRPGVVIAVGQWWTKLAPDKRSLNHLTSQELTDLGGGSLFGNSVVRIAAAVDSTATDSTATDYSAAVVAATD
ncbi:MAG: molybdopterin-dependent oxidoreductase [Planctomycetales bacterium]|nr:molybdopterin-dependent oxidoreductase [Planctomycetales bacterium]